MIESAPGRDDLEYRYSVTIEHWALLDAEQQEHFRNGPDCRYLSDPSYESEFPDLEWVKIDTVSFAKTTAKEAGLYIQSELGPTIRIGPWLYHSGVVRLVQDNVICRASVSVRHDASVPESEWNDGAAGGAQ